jgi:hypothetical protein
MEDGQDLERKEERKKEEKKITKISTILCVLSRNVP